MNELLIVAFAFFTGVCYLTSNSNKIYLTFPVFLMKWICQPMLRTSASHSGSEERRAFVRPNGVSVRYFNSVVSIEDCTKMVSQRCGLHSMVVYTNYI